MKPRELHRVTQQGTRLGADDQLFHNWGPAARVTHQYMSTMALWLGFMIEEKPDGGV